MGENFLGLGVKKLIGISIFVIIFIVMLKVILTKYPVKGVSDVVQAV